MPSVSDPIGSLAEAVSAAAAGLGGDPSSELAIKVERPPEADFGDYSTNAALLLAPVLDKSPRDVAVELSAVLEDEMSDRLDRVEVAGPGFVNLYLADSWFRLSLEQVLQGGSSYGAGVAKRGERMMLEFVSANPTGPLHIGHGRHAAFGDSLARILELAGHEVAREFYINDYGSQIKRFGESIAARKRGDDVPEDGYRGEYIERIAEELVEIEAEDAGRLARGGIEIMLDQIRRSLDRFRVRFDRWFSEASLHEQGLVERHLRELMEKGHAYEKDGAVWLRTTEFGDEKDRVLRRSSGETTYFAADIAYHEAKRSGEVDRMIDIWGADHHGYVGRMKAAFAAMGGDPERLELLIMQLVQILERGERAQMSKREGEFVTLDELVDDIGVDAARFFLLQRRHDTALDLDLDLAREQSQDNPVYYVQYAHARICSILRKADEEPGGGDGDGKGLAETPLHPSEKSLVKKLLEFPELVAEAAERREPHRFTAYAMEIASDFHAFYRDCRVVGAETPEAEEFRLGLCRATGDVIKRSLDLLGVEAPERM